MQRHGHPAKRSPHECEKSAPPPPAPFPETEILSPGGSQNIPKIRTARAPWQERPQSDVDGMASKTKITSTINFRGELMPPNLTRP